MKRFIFTVCLLFTLTAAFAQNSENANPAPTQQTFDKNIFVGTWDTLVPETPVGDIKSVFVVAKDKNGNIVTKPNKEYQVLSTKCTDDTLTIVTNYEGHFCEIILHVVDADHLEGMSMEQYPIKATRIKDAK